MPLPELQARSISAQRGSRLPIRPSQWHRSRKRQRFGHRGNHAFLCAGLSALHHRSFGVLMTLDFTGKASPGTTGNNWGPWKELYFLRFLFWLYLAPFCVVSTRLRHLPPAKSGYKKSASLFTMMDAGKIAAIKARMYGGVEIKIEDRREFEFFTVSAGASEVRCLWPRLGSPPLFSRRLLRGDALPRSPRLRAAWRYLRL